MAPTVVTLGPDEPLTAAAEAAGERVLVVDPALRLDDDALGAHAVAEGVAVGRCDWDADAGLSTLAAYLADGDALLGRRRVRPGDRVHRESFAHVSLPVAWLRLEGLESLAPRWQRIACWRRLLIDGHRPRRVAATARWTTSPPTEAEHLERLQAFAAGAREAYDVEPDLLPRATRRFGPMLPPASGPSPMSQLAAFDLLGRATAGAIDPALLDRLEDRLLFDAFAASLWERPADDDFLPLAYAEAMSMRRDSPTAAAEALAALVGRSPLVCGCRVVRVLLDAKDYDQALETAEALQDEPLIAAFARVHLMAGEAALAIGELDRAEASFVRAYGAAERPIETAAQVAALFARYGPAPAARPHLLRIVDDSEGRSSTDLRDLVAPARERLAALP